MVLETPASVETLRSSLAPLYLEMKGLHAQLAAGSVHKLERPPPQATTPPPRDHVELVEEGVATPILEAVAQSENNVPDQHGVSLCNPCVTKPVISKDDIPCVPSGLGIERVSVFPIVGRLDHEKRSCITWDSLPEAGLSHSPSPRKRRRTPLPQHAAAAAIRFLRPGW